MEFLKLYNTQCEPLFVNPQYITSIIFVETKGHAVFNFAAEIWFNSDYYFYPLNGEREAAKKEFKDLAFMKDVERFEV